MVELSTLCLLSPLKCPGWPLPDRSEDSNSPEKVEKTPCFSPVKPNPAAADKLPRSCTSLAGSDEDYTNRSTDSKCSP